MSRGLNDGTNRDGMIRVAPGAGIAAEGGTAARRGPVPADSPRLRRLIASGRQISGRAATAPAPTPPEASEERCELCSASIPAEHRHLLEIAERRLVCACRPCSLLFDHPEARRTRYRLVPDRVRRIEDLEIDDLAWSDLGVPVEMAFFFYSTPADRVVAFYPSPAGATESLLDLEAWRAIAQRHPILAEMEADVEALLVNRAGAAREHWIVPVDLCYRLVGLIRTHWKGFAGGETVWREIDGFFAELRRRAGARHG
jgi:hypothetical protein